MKFFIRPGNQWVEVAIEDFYKNSYNNIVKKDDGSYVFNLNGNIEFIEEAINFIKLHEIQERAKANFPEIARFATSQLCYVSPIREGLDRDFTVAYFTTQDLKEQCGDDWDDYPYEYNGDPPYDFIKGHHKKEYSIIRVKFDAQYCETNSGHFCVLDLNQKMSYWLKINEEEHIYAGLTLLEFLDVLKKHNKTFEVWEGYNESKPEW